MLHLPIEKLCRNLNASRRYSETDERAHGGGLQGPSLLPVAGSSVKHTHLPYTVSI